MSSSSFKIHTFHDVISILDYTESNVRITEG